MFADVLLEWFLEWLLFVGLEFREEEWDRNLPWEGLEI